MKVLSFSAALALAALLSIACGSSQKTGSTPQPTRGVQPTGSVVPSEQPGSSNQKQIGDLLLTVNRASLYTDEVFPAAPGTHYVAVDVTVKNTGDKDYLPNVLDFRLKDSDGHIHAPTITNGPEPQMSSYDSVVPGQEVRGFIDFPLVDGTDPAELEYQSPTGVTGAILVPKPSP